MPYLPSAEQIHFRSSLFKLLLISILIGGGKLTVRGVTVPYDTVSVHFRFPINSSRLNAAFSDNLAAFDALSALLDSSAVTTVGIHATASPDGHTGINIKLARERMNAMIRYLSERHGLPDSVIRPRIHEVSWERFRKMVSHDREVLETVSEGDDHSEHDTARRMTRLRKLDGGRTWEWIKNDIFPELRGADVTVTIDKVNRHCTTSPSVADSDTETPLTAKETDDEKPLGPAPADTTLCKNSWSLSANGLAWGLGITNLSAEYRFACRWSIALSAYYSAWNYFSDTRKFRTFILRPECRFWPHGNSAGLFFDMHLQMASYNFALPDWTFRIQDVGGNHPALGGGIGIGYRLPVGRSGHWAVEGQAGAGIYSLRYDRFENIPDGRLVDTRHRVWAGIDNISVGVVFNFDTAGR